MANAPVILKDRYEVKKKLGRGAMGDVFLAMDLQEEEPVAIKTISQDLYEKPEIRQRFTREVAALRKLDHPNIVSYIDAFTVKGRACLVMEYVGGGTLADILNDRGQLDLGFFKNIAGRVIDAMASAHDMGILHRDLKPANILMTAILEPKIGDFGLAKMLDLTTLTATGTAMGTLAYMPPEAFETLTRVDQRADIWALGVIFFEMLTGSLPFPATTQPQMIGAIMNEAPFDIRMYRQDVPPAWEMMIAQCLEKNPNHRYENVRDMLDDLNEIPRSRHSKFLTPLDTNFEFDINQPLFDDEGTAATAHAATSSRTRANLQTEALFSPDVQHGAAPDYMGRASQKKSVPMGALIFGGLLLWLGIAASLVGGGLIVYSYTSAGQDVDFLQSIETAKALSLVGALLFIGGLGIEATLIQPEKALELGVLIVGVGGVWFIFFSELVFTGFLGAVLGVVFYTVAIVLYFQTQRT